MIKQVYSIVDQKSQVFTPPFLAHNEDDAKRSVMMMLQNKNIMCSQYPEDFGLAHIGSFDDSQGVLEALPVPELVINLNVLKQKVKETEDDNTRKTAESA